MSGIKTAIRRLAKLQPHMRRACWLLLLVAVFPSSAMSAICSLYDERIRAHRDLLSAVQATLSVRAYSIREYNEANTDQCAVMMTVGHVAASRLSAWPGPVLHTLITHEQYQALYADGTFMPRSAVYMNHPLSQYLALIRTSMPERKHVLLLSSRLESDSLRSHASDGNRFDLDVEGIPFGQESKIDDILRKYARQDSVLLVLHDATVMNSDTARPLIMSAYQRNLPLITYSENLVRAGAMMSVHSSIEVQAQEAASRLQQWIGNSSWSRADYPENFSVAINYQLARAMRMDLPGESVVLELMQQVLK